MLKKSKAKIRYNVITLSDHTPLLIHESAEIIDMLALSDDKYFIILESELSHYPKETFFERAKEAIKNGELKINPIRLKR